MVGFFLENCKTGAIANFFFAWLKGRAMQSTVRNKLLRLIKRYLKFLSQNRFVGYCQNRMIGFFLENCEKGAIANFFHASMDQISGYVWASKWINPVKSKKKPLEFL